MNFASFRFQFTNFMNPMQPTPIQGVSLTLTDTNGNTAGYLGNQTIGGFNTPPGTYFDQIAQNWIPCPPECQSCAQNQSTLQVTCTKCTNLTVFDAMANTTCRKPCPPGSVFDFTQYTCLNCSQGSWSNPNMANKCYQCPNNCQTCNVNNVTGAMECGQCLPGAIFFPQNKGCMSNCTQNQVYNFSTGNCQACATNQFSSQQNNTC